MPQIAKPARDVRTILGRPGHQNPHGSASLSQFVPLV
jgi:hypothetical protein